MAGPQDWGAVPEPESSEGPQAWGAVPDVEAKKPDTFTERFAGEQPEQSIPAAFIDRVARGAVIMKDMYGYSFDVGKSAGKYALESTAEQARSVNERLNPFSEAYQTGRESGAWTGPGTQIGVGKGLFDLATLPLAPVGGAMTELIAQPYSKITGMSIDDARAAAGTALFAMRPGRVPNAPEFSRPRVGGEQPIGGLPAEADFRNGAEIMGGLSKETVEANLRRAWQEDGIHPAEAVHDAGNDAFLKHDLVQPIEAFHGSPHDFTVFSKEKIGTGEGAQSYGHGLYFAENEGVARSYQDTLADYNYRDPATAAAAYLKQSGGDRDLALSRMREQAINPVGVNAEEVRGIRDGYQLLKSGEPLPTLGEPGSLYQVSIHADREHFLDWDKPLDQQNQHVQDALRSVLKKEIDWSQPAGDFVRDLGYGQQSSDILYKAGIPGIKYLDQGSRITEPPSEPLAKLIDNKNEMEKIRVAQDRGTANKEMLDRYDALRADNDRIHADIEAHRKAQETRNFVVFDDSAVQIVKKNGQPFYDENFAKSRNAKLERIMDGQEEGDIPLRAVGAEVTTEPPLDTPLSTTPAKPPGSLMTAAHKAADKLLDMGRDAQMLVAPMARGTTDSMAMAKDFANTMRRNRWDWSRIDADIEKRFTPEQRARMWNAADEESVARQLGESTEHQGLITLEPAERAAVEELQTRAQTAWLRARDLGMVEGEGLPAYTPRMVMNATLAGSGEGPIPLNGMGLNLRTKTPNMRQRLHMTVEETEAAAKAKYGADAYVARDIRALPLATAQLEDAIAGRTLINNIKDYGKSTGAEMVSEGAIPAETEAKWFTLDHPAFRTWRPKFELGADGKMMAKLDANGEAIFEQVPIYVHGDFEGPLRAVLTQRSGPLYGAMMSLKGKTMSLIMNSPMIHNAVEWGRAMPAMPGKVATFKVYFEGNRVKNDPVQMREAIEAGLVPIGKRFFNQDITSIMESPDLAPGRSWTAKVLGAVPGLFDEAAGTAVKRSIDKAGDFWHNTLLWDRIADLQAGLYSNFRDSMVAKGIDRQTAARTAAHWANRYAGALPQEAMSDAARKVANTLLFSRSFTLGNLGVLKDMLTGLPKDVIAQIERDAGFGKGSIAAADAEAPAAGAVKYAKKLAMRKAWSVVALDVALMYVGNSMLQSVINVIRTDRTADEEMKGYADRFAAAMDNVKEHPLALLQPFDFMNRVASTYENEPGKQDRVRVGTAKDGTAVYARNPVGKIGEEFVGYMSGPLDMMRRKLGTIARPAWAIMSNDKGFGRKIYDPDADTPAKYMANIGLIAAHLAGSQFPEGQATAAADLVKGEGDKNVNAAQAFGPIAGVTFAKGAPGGPAVGEMYHAKAQHQFAIDQALPDIRKQIQRGDLTGAQERMTALGIAPGLQKFYVKTSLNPETRLGGRTLRDFYQYSTPEQRDRLERARQ